MDANLAARAGGRAGAAAASRYSNWGPGGGAARRRPGARGRDRAGDPGGVHRPKDDGDLTTVGNVGRCSWRPRSGFLLVPMAIAARRGAATLREILAAARRAPLRALGLEVDGGGGRRLPALRRPLLGAGRRTRTGGHRRRLRAGPGADPADRDRGADQRGGLLPRHALRRPARAAAALRGGADRRPRSSAPCTR